MLNHSSVIKSWTIILLLLLFTISKSESQVLIALVFGDKLNSDKMKFGLNLGGNISTFTNVDDANFDIGLQFGIFIDYKLNERLYFRPELNAFTNIVVDVDPYLTGNPELDTVLSSVELDRKLSYGSMALFLRYDLGNKWSVETGPRGSLRFKAQDIFIADVFEDEDLKFTRDIKDEVTLIDVGWAIGIGKRLFRGRGVYFSLRYYYGFIDVLKDEPGSQHVSSFQFNASIPIVGKKKEEEKIKESRKEGN